METITQRRVPASKSNTIKPAGVPTSAFDMGRQAKAEHKRPYGPRADFDIDSVEIRKNVPPHLTSGRA